MIDFSEELRRAIKRAHLIEKDPVEVHHMNMQHAPKVKLYNLVKVEGEKRDTVGFGLTLDEANTLSKALLRKIKRLGRDTDSGGTMFEITSTEIESA